MSSHTPPRVQTHERVDVPLLSGIHRVTLHSDLGDIVLSLDATVAPKTVTNFVTLATQGYYDGLTFHRVIPGFMIQGGDPNGDGTGGKSVFGPTFKDEIDPRSPLYQDGYKAGSVAMANHGPNTNGSQFFIMESDYPLPPHYTIFGRVTEGQDVVHAIAQTERSMLNDRPLKTVKFTVEVMK